MNRMKQFLKLILIIIISSVQIFKAVQNESIVDQLEPKDLWRYFAAISDIPRASGNETHIANYILKESKLLELQAFKDSIGNVIVKKPASNPLYKNSPIVVIQSHMDMVCEKNKNIEHDFSKDSIKFVMKDNFLYANGTTLGADNGIGVAASLALMRSNNIAHGPLEFLFTVMEEAGFDGADNVTEDSIQGRILLNIDTEEEGSIYIGCAGSNTLIGKLPIVKTKVENSKFFSVVIDGLRGGHSGVDIDKDRVNAIQLVKLILNKLNVIDYDLVSINGGNKLNAIARDVELIISIRENLYLKFEEVIEKIIKNIFTDFRAIENGLTIERKEIKINNEVLDKDSKNRIITLLNTLPHGVIKMSPIIDNLVNTSTNFAKISTNESYMTFGTMQRSLVKSELEEIVQLTHDIFSSVNAVSTLASKSPEWQPNSNSKVLNIASKSYFNLFNKQPEIKAIHAGLECGSFVNRIKGLDAISFGPTIYDAHSPNEHIDIKTVKPFWEFLIKLIEDIAKS